MKTLIAAAALALASASASAGTVSFSNFTHKDATGFGTSFDDIYSLNLGSDTWVNGLLITSSQLGGLPAIDVQSVTLRRLGASLAWNETDFVDWDVAEAGVERWLLSPHRLAAGQWQLEVTGVTYYDKTGNGYTATLQLPEPASVALAVLALAGAGATTLRRRKA